MHEMGLAQAILQTVLSIGGERPIRRVAVSAGTGQAVNRDSLEFSFQLVADGTSAGSALLEVRAVDGDRVLVDEVEVGGEMPEVLRRPGVEVVEAAHEHAHENDEAPVHPAWL